MIPDIYKFMKQNRIIAVGPDGKRRGKNFDLLSQYEIEVDQAFENGLWWLSDPENRSALAELRKEYLHLKGWSQTKEFKSKYNIPFEVFTALPKYMQGKAGAKKLRAFIRTFLPQLELAYKG